MEESKKKKQKKIVIPKNDLTQSLVLTPPKALELQNVEVADYIDDFLQISPDAVFINDENKTAPKRKKVKKIIKKKIVKTKANNKIKGTENNQSKIEEKETEILKDKEKIKMEDNSYNDSTLPDIVQKNKEKKDGKNINQESEEDIEKRLLAYISIYCIIKSKIVFELKNTFKLLFIFKKIKNCQINSSTKITNAYKGYLIRKNLKLNYLTKKILKFRDLCASKIISHYKGYNIRKLSKGILKKKEDFYIIYSSLSNNSRLYFKIRYTIGLEDNIYFDKCKLLNCFIFYINRRDKNFSKKKVAGFFYNEKYEKLTDDMYEKNEKGENILNFPKILKKTDLNSEKYDKIINEYIKAHRPVIRKRENIIDYEEKKKKALDDDMVMNNKKFGEKLNKMSRSKSFMRLKGIMKNKGILKPSKSYINLKCDDKKIQFGKAKIKGYHIPKK